MKKPDAKLVIVADLGRLRAFRLLPTGLDNDRPFTMEEVDPALAETQEQPEPIHAQVSDQAGRFPAQAPGMSAGEAGLHEREREQERKLIGQLAERINKTVEREKFESWNLSAPQPILQHLLSVLDHEVRERLTSTFGHDYTKLPLEKLGPIFAEAK